MWKNGKNLNNKEVRAYQKRKGRQDTQLIPDNFESSKRNDAEERMKKMEEKCRDRDMEIIKQVFALYVTEVSLMPN